MTGDQFLRLPPPITPFTGRAVEVALLCERLDAAARSEGSLVLVGGEAGAGKTRLLAEIGAYARAAGCRVANSRAYDTQGMPPYLPYIEAVQQLRHVVIGEDILEPLRGVPALTSLLPSLQDQTSTPDLARSPSPDAERLRIFEAISECFLRAAASAPGLLLGIDDLQWADASTLQLLRHLARKLDGSRLLVVATYRPETAERSTPLSETLAALARERLDLRLELGPLSEEETRVLVASISGVEPSAQVGRVLHEWTGGNSLFVEEVTRQMLSEQRDFAGVRPVLRDWGVPEQLSGMIQQRLSGLTLDSRRVLQAAAVIGETFGVQFLHRICQVPDNALVEGLEELTRSGVLREEEPLYAFSHPLVREVVYGGISLARRQQLHSAAAAAIQADSVNQEQSLAVAGHHWRLGGQPERAAGLLLDAGEKAVYASAWPEAVAYWQSALECMEQADYPAARRAALLESLGDLHFIGSFEATRAIECYEGAIALYDAAGDTLGSAQTHSKAGRCLAYPTLDFDAPAALTHIRAAAQLMDPGEDSFELGELLFAFAHAETHAMTAKTREVLDAIDRLRSLAERLDNGFLRVAATSLQGHFLILEGRLAEGIALETEACDHAATLVAAGGSLWPEGWLASILGSENSAGAAEASSPQIARYFPGYLKPYTINCCGLQSLDLGDPVTARAKHEQIRDPLGRFLSPFLLFDVFLAGEVETLRQFNDPERQLTNPMSLAAAYSTVMLSWCDGQWQEVEAGMLRLLEPLRTAGSDSLAMFGERWLARLHRVDGNMRGVKETLHEACAKATACGAVKFEMLIRPELALLEAEGGRLEEAEWHLVRCRELLDAGEDWRGVAGRIALAEAVLAAAQRRNEDASDHFERALEVFRAYMLPWDQTEAYELWARAGARYLRGRNRTAFVREKLDAARAIYERIGAGQPWLDRLGVLRRSLIRRGAPELQTNPMGLSARQQQVLALIARGKTNGEIADELVISLRTVERHVAELYAKLGARNRVEAAAFAMSNLIRA